MEKDSLIHGDCLVEMKDIPDKSIDMILCDLPYGTTNCKWDSSVPLGELWKEYNRIIKTNGVIALFGTEPFSTYLRLNNIKAFKYDWIWKKTTATGFQHAKNMPLKNYEIISIFSNGSMGHKNLLGEKRMPYNPQGIIRVDKVSKPSKNPYNLLGKRPSYKDEFITEFINYPTMVLEFPKDRIKLHSAQKPVALLEYLIKTYTNEGDLVLDNACGSGSTCVACVNTNRHYIGIEKEKEYYDISVNRVEEAKRLKEV